MAKEISKKENPSKLMLLKTFLRLIKFAYQGNKVAIPTMYFVLFIVALVPFGTTFIESKIIDEVVSIIGLGNSSKDYAHLYFLIGIVVFLTFAEKILWAVSSYFEKMIYFGSSRYLTQKFLEKASTLDLMHYESQKTSSIIHKAKDIYDWKPREAVSRSFWISADIVRIITSMIIVLSFSLPAFLLVIATTLPGLIANLKLGKDSWGIWDADSETRNKYWWTRDMISREENLMEIRIFKAKYYLMNIVTEIYDSFTNKVKTDQLKRSVLESILGNLSTIGITGFWIFAIYSAVQGDITIGLMTFYVGSINRFSNALSEFFRRVSYEYEDLLYVKDLFAFYDLKNEIVDGDMRLNLADKHPPTLEFRNVSFKYPDTEKYVIKDLNLRIESGEKVAFVGVNGAGKTTIIKLICRLYDVTEGEFLIDGVNVKQLSIEDYYSKIGVLFQNFVKAGQFSVRQNIEIGNIDKKSNDESIANAIHMADAKDFIDEYKKGWEQVLDKSFENGIDPSGGQWQRIALARAFFRDAPILILDEPTSAVDAQAEFEIFERLYEFTKNKTVLIVSHRFSTVRKADRIVVVDKGEIVESGSHEELLKLNGEYAKAFSVQAKGYT